MAIIAYINFQGTTREAVAFYAKVFGSPEPRIMSFAEMGEDPAHPIDAATKKLIAHAELLVDGSTMMFSDVTPDMSLTRGDNVSLMVQTKDGAAIRRWFGSIKEGGQVIMDLAPQPWSKLYCLVHDRFGIGWQFNLVE